MKQLFKTIKKKSEKHESSKQELEITPKTKS